PLLNYDQNIEWKRAREGRLYDGNFVQTSHGSLTTWLLLQYEEAVINQKIGDDFIFRFRYKSYDNRHLSYNEKVTTVGLGYNLNENFTLIADTDLSDLKEEVDIKPGILYTFQTVYAYFGVSFDDFIFDLKNMGDGKNSNLPLTLSTDIRFSFSRLYFFISGNYGTGFERTWDPGPYTDKLYHKQQKKNFYGRIEYDINDRLKPYAEFFYDDFFEAKDLKDTTLDTSQYSFSAKVSNAKIGALWALNKKSRIDAGAAYAILDHKMDVTEGTRQSYTIKYPALLPYIIYKYDIHTKFTGEISYMGSYTVNEDEDNYYYAVKDEHYWDKELIKLGFEYRFSPNASLYISAGQLINTGVFGGGNARFNLVF
ncbi:MAG: hypothetical protein R6V47_01550, partial [Candidatus Delongbacteria bacterium]